MAIDIDDLTYEELIKLNHKVGVRVRYNFLRHTSASWHVQAGTPLNALQELGGWSSSDMVRRYAHLGAGHLAGYADNILCHSVSTIGTNLAQSEN